MGSSGNSERESIITDLPVYWPLYWVVHLPTANYSSVCAPLADSVILQSKIWTCERQKGEESGDGVPLKRPTMI